MKKFRDFESAREFARSLKLKGEREWREYYKSGNKPDDIPSTPNQVYKNKGWKGFGDWLGTGRVSSFNIEFCNFDSARKYTRGLKLKNVSEWRKYRKSGKMKKDIPSTPEITYKRKWIGWGDFLGTGNVASINKSYHLFESAREFVRKLGLKNHNEWNEYVKSGNKPDDIPATPESVYKNKGWKGFGDWLGTSRVANFNIKFRDYESSKKYVRKLNLKNQKEWQEYCTSGNKPDDIPSTPNGTYKNKGWKGFGDFLGSNRVATQDRQYRDFESAREFVRSLGIKGDKEWREYYKSGNKPDDIPSAPWLVYKGWKGFGDFLGSNRVATQDRQYRDFESAREFVRSLKLNSQQEWNDFRRSGQIPDDIPSSPDRTYKNKGWTTWGDFLGNGNVAHTVLSKQYLPFKEAREFVRCLGLKSTKEWEEYCKSGNKPENIPSTPMQFYKKWKKK